MTAESDNLPLQRVNGLGELTWTDDGWTGPLEWDGGQIQITLLCDLKKPTREDKLAILETADRAREQLAKLRQVEPEWRLRVAKEIAIAAGEQTSEEAVQENLIRAEAFAASLVLDEITLHGSGELHYHDTSGEFPPEEPITIYFNEEVEYEAD